MRSPRDLRRMRSEVGISSTVLIVLVAILVVNTVIGIFLVLNAQKKPSGGPVPNVTPAPGQAPTPQPTLPGPAPTAAAQPTLAAQPSPESSPGPVSTQAAPPPPPEPTQAGPPLPQPPIPTGEAPAPLPPEPQTTEAVEPTPMPRPTRAEVALDEQYEDPSGRFSLAYPTGWKVDLVGGGFISFYKDHAEQGTAFILHPLADVKGVGGRAVLRTLERTARSTYPDFEVLSADVEVGKVGTSAEGGQIGRMSARWTNHRGERMRGRLWVLVISFTGSSKATYIAYQAPEIAFESMEPVFRQMYAALEIAFPHGIKPPY